MFNMLDKERLVKQAGSAAVWAGTRRGRRSARWARFSRTRAGLAYLSAQRRHPEPHPHTGRCDRRAQGRQRLPRVRAPQRRRATIAVDCTGTGLSVGRRPGYFWDGRKQAEARRTFEIPESGIRIGIIRTSDEYTKFSSHFPFWHYTFCRQLSRRFFRGDRRVPRLPKHQ